MPRSTLLLGSCILIGSVTLAWYWQRPHSDEPVAVSYTHLCMICALFVRGRPGT